jgi:hypothetical protein
MNMMAEVVRRDMADCELGAGDVLEMVCVGVW